MKLQREVEVGVLFENTVFDGSLEGLFWTL